MNELMKCPHCGSANIDVGDWFDSDLIFDVNRQNEIVIHKMSGYCDDCKTKLLWEEVYEFTGYQNIIIND